MRTVLDEIRVHGSFETLNAKISQCLSVDNIPALLELVNLFYAFIIITTKVLARIECDFAQSESLVRNVMAMIWLSRRGLSERETMELTHIPTVTWSELSLALSDLIASRSGKQYEYNSLIWHRFY